MLFKKNVAKEQQNNQDLVDDNFFQNKVNDIEQMNKVTSILKENIEINDNVNLEIDDKTDLNFARSIAKYNNLK